MNALQNFLITLPLIIPVFSIAQIDTTKTDLPYKDNKVVYEYIGEVKDVDKATIYAGAKKWISDSFKSSKSVIQSEDVTSGQIIGKGSFKINLPNQNSIFGNVVFIIGTSIKIDAKENKYRIRLYDITIQNQVGEQIVSNETAIETYDGIARANIRKKPNKKERWTEIVESTNNTVFSLIESFKKEIDLAAKDKF